MLNLAIHDITVVRSRVNLVTRSDPETDHCLDSNVDIKNAWNCKPTCTSHKHLHVSVVSCLR